MTELIPPKAAQGSVASALKQITVPEKWMFSITALAILLGVVGRIYNLNYPSQQVFDELYFPNMALHYLRNQRFFDVHPPLGKLLLIPGIAVFGHNATGWRIVPLMFGLGNIFLVGAISWELFRNRVGVAIVSSFVALDGMFIVYSRVGLLDGIQFFFVFLCILLALRKRLPATMLAVALGLCASIKWLGLAVIVPVIEILAWQGKVKRVVAIFAIASAVYLAVVVLGQSLVLSPSPLRDALSWHVNAMQVTAASKFEHPYSSSWWSWPLMGKPLLMYSEDGPNWTSNVIWTTGNWFIWHASTLAVLVSCYHLCEKWTKTRFVGAFRDPLFVLVSGYAASLLPWILIHRTVFIYHYMPAYGFAMLCLSYWVTELWQQCRGFAFASVAAATCVAFITFPMNVGWIAVPRVSLLPATPVHEEEVRAINPKVGHSAIHGKSGAGDGTPSR